MGVSNSTLAPGVSCTGWHRTIAPAENRPQLRLALLTETNDASGPTGGLSSMPSEMVEVPALVIVTLKVRFCPTMAVPLTVCVNDRSAAACAVVFPGQRRQQQAKRRHRQAARRVCLQFHIASGRTWECQSRYRVFSRDPRLFWRLSWHVDRPIRPLGCRGIDSALDRSAAVGFTQKCYSAT